MKFGVRTTALLLLISVSATVFAQVDVLTRSYNNARTGANLHETTTLTPVDPDEGVQAVAACCRFMPARGRF